MTVYRVAELGRVPFAYLNRTVTQFPLTRAKAKLVPTRSAYSSPYFVKARMILAEIWRKNMDAMKESERTRTMKGSLGMAVRQREGNGEEACAHSESWRIVGVQLEHGIGRSPCTRGAG